MRKWSNAEINARLASKEYDDVREKVSTILDQIVNDGPRLIGAVPQIGFALVIFPVAQGETRVVFTTNDPDERHAAACMRQMAMELDGRPFRYVVEQTARKLVELDGECSYKPDDTPGGAPPVWTNYVDRAREILLVAYGVQPVEEPADPGS